MKERELLQRVVTAWEDDRYELIDAMYFVVKDIQAYLANQETDTNPSETISNPEIDRSECIALLEVMQGEDGKECYYKTLINDLPFGGYELYLAREPAHEALGAALKEWFPVCNPEECDDVYMKRGIFTHGWIEAELHHGIAGGEE